MKRNLIFIILILILLILIFSFVIGDFFQNPNSIVINPFQPNPELQFYKIEIDNGLKISYKEDYSVTFNLNFTLKSGQTYKWDNIPLSIDKKLWRNQIEGNKFDWGVDFNNVSSQIKNDLDYLTLFITNSTGLSWNDINSTEDNIIIKNKVSINKDFLENFDVYINKTSKNIIIKGFDNIWQECVNWNEAGECIESITLSHWKLNEGINTYNVSIF